MTMITVEMLERYDWKRSLLKVTPLAKGGIYTLPDNLVAYLEHSKLARVVQDTPRGRMRAPTNPTTLIARGELS